MVLAWARKKILLERANVFTLTSNFDFTPNPNRDKDRSSKRREEKREKAKGKEENASAGAVKAEESNHVSSDSLSAAKVASESTPQDEELRKRKERYCDFVGASVCVCVCVPCVCLYLRDCVAHLQMGRLLRSVS